MWVPTVQPDTTWKQGTLFIKIVKCAYLPCQGRFKTPVMFAELNLARPDVLVLSSSCSPSPGIRHTAARPTWQGIYLLQGVLIKSVFYRIRYLPIGIPPCYSRVILILKILLLQLLHGFKLFHLVSHFQNSFCF